MNLYLAFIEGVPYILIDGQTVAALTSADGHMIGLYQDQEPVYFQTVSQKEMDRLTFRFECAGWEITDRFQLGADGLLRGNRQWRNISSAAQSAALAVELYRSNGPLNYLVPAVSYNGNRWGQGLEPKGLVDQASPGREAWVYGGDRTSLPACTITEGQGWAIALYTSPELANQSACGLREHGPGLVQQVRWPLQELPRLYARRDTYAPGLYQELVVEAGASCYREYFISIQPARYAQDYQRIFERAWQQLYQPIPVRDDSKQIWKLGIQFAKEFLWSEDEAYHGFVLGRMLKDGQWQPSTWNLAEIGWCGQNGTFACMMLQDYLWHGDQDSLRRGQIALDEWDEKCVLPNGLMYTHIDDVLKGKQEARLETCNLGGGAYAYLLASELAEQVGLPQRSRWLAVGLGVCDFFLKHMLPDGRFGRYWRSDGVLLDAEGTVGSWMIWPLLKAYRITGKTEYLNVAIRGFRYYCEHDLAQFCITAGALDTDCIDKEGAFPLLMAGLELYEITSDAAYLEQAERAAVYLATWQWHYDLAYPPGTAAEMMSYHTFGGTSVSVQHHHLDPWGALIALGWLRLGQYTGNRQWSERGAAAYRQATYGVSGGSLTIDGITRPAGGQDEGFYHMHWGNGLGGVSNWLVAWPGAFRLFTLQQWSDWAGLDEPAEIEDFQNNEHQFKKNTGREE